MNGVFNDGKGIRWVLSVYLILVGGNVFSQDEVPNIIGKSFIALNALNADSTAIWYEQMFGVKLLKEIKTADGSAHIRIEGNQFLMVEIIQVKGSKTLGDCQWPIGKSHLLRGYFKAGLFVRDIEKAEKYFQSKGVSIPHKVFSDKETAIRSFILEDPSGNLLQFIQEIDSSQGK